MDNFDVDKFLDDIQREIKKDRIWSYRVMLALAIMAIGTLVLILWK